MYQSIRVLLVCSTIKSEVCCSLLHKEKKPVLLLNEATRALCLSVYQIYPRNEIVLIENCENVNFEKILNQTKYGNVCL